MKTPVLAREKGRINDLHVQSNGDSAGQRSLGHYGSEMDVDQGLGSGPPGFARTREDNVPVEDGDYADIKPLAIDLTGDDGQRAFYLNESYIYGSNVRTLAP
ncbi:hypothetical protein BDV18DRAFT_152473 [Aspergillus unguis]